MSDRRSLEDSSLKVTEKYFRMQEEMMRSSIPAPVSPKFSADSFFYVRVAEISSNWLTDERPLWQTTSKFFVGLFSADIQVSVVMNSDGVKTDVFVGTLGEKFGILQTMLKGCFPQLRWQEDVPILGADQWTKKNRIDAGGFWR